MRGLERWLNAREPEVLQAVRAAIRCSADRCWSAGEGVGAGIDGDGKLVVQTSDGPVALDAGEVHLAAETPEA